MDWEPGSITWYVDGFLGTRFAVSITQPEYLIADLAVNGKLPPNSAVRFPQSLVIRSIQVWQHPAQTERRQPTKSSPRHRPASRVPTRGPFRHEVEAVVPPRPAAGGPKLKSCSVVVDTL